MVNQGVFFFTYVETLILKKFIHITYKNLNTVPKIFESVITNKLKLLVHSYLALEQFGFIEGRNIEANLMFYSQYILDSHENKQEVDSIYTDFIKTFDTVNHTILITKLKSFGIKYFEMVWELPIVQNTTC